MVATKCSLAQVRHYWTFPDQFLACLQISITYLKQKNSLSSTTQMPLSPSSIYLCIFSHGRTDRAVSVKAAHTPIKIISEKKQKLPFERERDQVLLARKKPGSFLEIYKMSLSSSRNNCSWPYIWKSRKMSHTAGFWYSSKVKHNITEALILCSTSQLFLL